MTIISRFRGSKDEDPSYPKNRSSSIESTSSVHHETIDRTSRGSEDYLDMDRRKSTPYVLDSRGVITASLTIPVQPASQGLALNVDDDIPYIEDGDNNGKQHMTIGLVRTPTAPPRRRQRSMSGSDSSVASNVQPITGSISLVQQGYDSALGSSATYNSPPHNTTPSSIGSSIADPGVYSSPPSWASTPPTSPESTNTSVNYIPDDSHIHSQSKQTSTSKAMPIQKSSSKEIPILQKVSFTSVPEVQQLRVKQADKATPGTQKHLTAPEIQKSPSSPTFTGNENVRVPEQKFTPSITSIGNAVLRSKTADFERIAKTDSKTKLVPTTQAIDKKKYAKRRYTDSRHQTRHIPDSESLESASGQSKRDDKTIPIQAPVYKRRELISSVPSK